MPLTGLGGLSSGAPLTVWFDPDDHTTFDIDWTIVPQGAPAQADDVSAGEPGTVERLRRLDELRAAGMVSEDEYTTQRARILGEL